MAAIDEDYNPFTEEDLQKLLREEKSSSSEEGWTFVKKNDLSEIWRKNKPDQPVHLIKAFLSFPGIPADKVTEMFYDLNIRKKWDKQFVTIDTVEEHKNYKVVYWLTKMPPGVTNRDIVQYMRLQKDEDTNTSYILYKNATHEKYPETSKTVRAETILSGLIIRPDPDNSGSTKVSVLIQNDFKGSIPHLIVNTFATSAPESSRESMSKYYREHYAGN